MCIFCKIIKKEIPAEIVYEDDSFLAFKDINPKADLHLLLIPKKHIESIQTLKEEECDLMGGLILVAKKIAEEQKLSGYKLHINVGKEGGQEVFHLHLHLLSGVMQGSL